jgi:hypothetical protein
MADLTTILDNLRADGTLQRIAVDPRTQFGIVGQPPLMGATILPEVTVPANAFTETEIRYRTFVANDGTRYSPVQKRPSGLLTGEFTVVLGNSDVGADFTAKDYEGLLRYLQSNQDMTATAAVINWVLRSINLPLVVKNEVQRWQAIVGASVVRAGDNGYSETVTYSNPAGHRVSAGGTWSNNTYDPYDDIQAGANKLYDKGFLVGRIITTRKVLTIMARNAKIASRAGQVRVLSNTDIIGRATIADINQMMQADGLPAFETYDNTYEDLSGIKRYLAEGTMIFIATTGRDIATQAAGTFPLPAFQRGTELGYTAIGTATGQLNPGRVVRVEAYENKPPRLEGEGWQTSLPVLTEPEAVFVITGIA